ncbi:hypothetical protein Dsin_009261 [Dipteronia sinensis]|uniref:Uncharacterized protein n=1 Tax=Dipteronia sinensis TaxID=43782 RepID=A0AAE0AQ85_9ROSI|nr:hypothetical protein Dsin_009261 [Dipteronia sinensis]
MILRPGLVACNLWLDGRWVLDDCFRASFPDLGFWIGWNAIAPIADSLVWDHSRDGQVSYKAAYFWSGLQLASQCSVCGVSSESADHHLVSVSWRLFFGRLFSRISSGVFLLTLGNLFYCRPCRFRLVIRIVLSLVWRAVSDSNLLEIGCMRNCVADLIFLKRLGLCGCPIKAPVMKSVIWLGWIKVNKDGADLSSSGIGGCGGVFRNYQDFLKGYFAIPLGQVFAFEAELLTASLAINFAWKYGWRRI